MFLVKPYPTFDHYEIFMAWCDMNSVVPRCAESSVFRIAFLPIHLYHRKSTLFSCWQRLHPKQNRKQRWTFSSQAIVLIITQMAMKPCMISNSTRFDFICLQGHECLRFSEWLHYKECYSLRLPLSSHCLSWFLRTIMNNVAPINLSLEQTSSMTAPSPIHEAQDDENRNTEWQYGWNALRSPPTIEVFVRLFAKQIFGLSNRAFIFFRKSQSWDGWPRAGTPRNGPWPCTVKWGWWGQKKGKKGEVLVKTWLTCSDTMEKWFWYLLWSSGESPSFLLVLDLLCGQHRAYPVLFPHW